MNILIVSDAWQPQVNGVVRTYQGILPELRAAGHAVTVLGPRDFPRRVPMPGYPEIELALFPRQTLARTIDALKPDTVHIATEGPLGWAARAICLRRGWPFTTCFHTHFPDYIARRVPRPLAGWAKTCAINMLRRFHNRSSAVLTVGPDIDMLLRGWGVTAPCRRFTRGVDQSLFRPASLTKSSDQKRPVAIYVGRLAVEKNVEAFLSMPWPGTRMVVGDGPLKETLARVYPETIFTGVLHGEALAKAYRAADVFVFPSRTDTFGMVMVEAFGCGLPVAAYPVTGPKGIVTQAMLGALDEDLGRAAVAALHAPGSARDRHAYIAEHYSWREAAAQFVDACRAAMLA